MRLDRLRAHRHRRWSMAKPSACDRGRQRRRELPAEGVIDIDHRRSEARPLEQALLGRTVGLHAAVVVEMVAGQVGEHREAEPHAVDAPLFERVRGDFHGDVGRAPSARKRASSRCTLITSGVVRSPASTASGKARAERADRRRATTQAVERLGEQLHGRGLAVGAGDAADAQARARHRRWKRAAMPTEFRAQIIDPDHTVCKAASSRADSGLGFGDD